MFATRLLTLQYSLRQLVSQTFGLVPDPEVPRHSSTPPEMSESRFHMRRREVQMISLESNSRAFGCDKLWLLGKAHTSPPDKRHHARRTKQEELQ